MKFNLNLQGSIREPDDVEAMDWQDRHFAIPFRTVEFTLGGERTGATGRLNAVEARMLATFLNSAAAQLEAMPAVVSVRKKEEP